jgi:protein TonB
MADTRRYAIAVMLSIGAHAFAHSELSALPTAEALKRSIQSVSFAIVQPAEGKTLRAPALKPNAVPPEPPKPTARPPVRRAPEASPEPVSDEATARKVEPVDLTGLTLTAGQSGAQWEAPAGTGEGRDGALPNVRPRRETEARPQKPERLRPAHGVRAPDIVPVSDLSEKPAPPDLDRELARNFPESARRAGVSGLAVVQAVVTARGSVERVRIVTESFPGFGAACEKTLAGSRWLPPRDRSGRPVSTEITYRCRFRIES